MREAGEGPSAATYPQNVNVCSGRSPHGRAPSPARDCPPPLGGGPSISTAPTARTVRHRHVQRREIGTGGRMKSAGPFPLQFAAARAVVPHGRKIRGGTDRSPPPGDRHTASAARMVRRRFSAPHARARAYRSRNSPSRRARPFRVPPRLGPLQVFKRRRAASAVAPLGCNRATLQQA
jgi:hypothetical protein